MTQAPEIPPETAEVALAVAKIFATLDAEAAQKYIAPDFVDHESSSPEIGSGPDGYLATAGYMRAAFSDAQWRPLEFFARGDKFAVVVEFSGRHTGDFLGSPPAATRSASGTCISTGWRTGRRWSTGARVTSWPSCVRSALPETSAVTPADAAQAS